MAMSIDMKTKKTANEYYWYLERKKQGKNKGKQKSVQ